MASSRPAALIVEDQPFVGMVASDILKESGFETFYAYDAEAAAELLEAHPEIEVVVTEAQLPGDVDGVELCRRVSQERPDVQLVVTAASPELHQNEVPNGARVLRKPFASGELQTLVAPKLLLSGD
jgi:Response regulators consisting of a CheY-like receiver domain and a winged-helix DNA-binding domain